MAQAAKARIEALDFAPGHAIALDATKSPRTVALIIACLMARRPFLLPPQDLDATALEALLDRAGCLGLLAAGAPVIRPKCGSAAPPAGPVPGGGTSFMFTTSGSTGLPKVVPLPAAAVDRFTGWAGAASAWAPTRWC